MKRFAYIDAVRGYAIVLVLAVHSSQMITGLPWAASTLATQGARGVQMFFVASALTLCLSWQSRSDGAGPFYIRRLFRIAPMFWLALIFYVSRDGLGPRYYAPAGVGTGDVAATALFLNGFIPNAITSIVPGSWSIADEMIFYAIFPLIAAYLLPRSWLLTAALIAGAILANEKITPLIISHADSFVADPAQRYMVNVFVTLWFPQQLPTFLTGVMVAQVMRTARPMLPQAAAALTFASVALMIALAFSPAAGAIGAQSLYGAVFGLFVLCLWQYQPAYLVNPIICWIGKVSFSAYLIHFAVMPHVAVFHLADPLLDFAAMFAYSTAFSVALATATYFLIERPMILLGNRLIERRAECPAPAY
ncbi:peptidoglycan/LPS O-acetylase OafA/YrhL [Bradyrhizobium diazoefficiens]|uniref:Putative acyltransferase 3 n=2 Tax=Nitrobacteraceae TaxID=41294 RepID=A0A837CM20_9BRAD|nr:hypothetical protein BD122_24275 [Bradyrhizobium diazoefficiens]KGJ70025.1 putative acyltransferase 3 [Bradyrhizobium diazoefficiens SEMIA 5080]KOY09370.1 hypothetical protein AF336_15465 [Bradyrhizobium diazoefficiens]